MKTESNWPIIGHSQIIALFNNLLARPKLNNHAFLFYGQRRLGKTTLAEELARRLLGLTNDQSVWNQPDVHLLERLPDKSEIGIEQVRNWQQDLALKPFSAPYKVGIIQEAENLNSESSNALLKVLEEPSGQTVIILIANDWQRLLPTIRSRAQGISFLPVPTKLIEQGLIERGASSESAKKYSTNCYWRPGLALTWLNNADLFLEKQSQLESLKKIMQSNLGQRSNYLLKVKDFSAETFKEELSLWEQSLPELIHWGQLPMTKILKIAANLHWAKNLARANVTPQLIWEYLIMSL